MPRKLLACVFAVLFIWGLVACSSIGLNAAALPMALSLIGLLLALFWKSFRTFISRLRKKAVGRIFVNAAITLIMAAVLCFIAVSGLMISAAAHDAPTNAMVIVLGCQVRGETPSPMLLRRTETALGYLNENPGSVCIVSGGRGTNESISEAECMKRILVANGIAESRIFLEDRSTSTYENIKFSKAIIEANRLPQTVVIATDGFHQFRALNFAKREGLNASPVTSRTPLSVLPFYWLREVIAIVAWAPAML